MKQDFDCARRCDRVRLWLAVVSASFAALGPGIASADGGRGGNGSAPGGTGAGGFTSVAGTNGGNGGAFGGGGGGGGAGGGAGGSGGTGVTLSGGAGGAGGVNGATVVTLTNTTPLSGAAGVAGSAGGAGGGGGAGGYGALVSGNGTHSNTSTITGGSAGAGGNGSTLQAGSGGDGGIGIMFTNAGNATLLNSGTISGGNGAAAGSGVTGGATAGAGGVGISTSGIFSINNSGTISGGLGGDGVTRAAAILANGNGTLSITSASSIVGGIVLGGQLTISQGGTATLSSVVSGAGSIIKTGPGATILSGANTYTGGTTLNSGTLVISSSANLGGAAGTLTFNNGTLQTTATMAMTRATTLNAGGGLVNVNPGTTLILSGAIGGTGALIKLGGGTLTLAGVNSYGGGTTVAAGVLQGSATSLQGNILNNTTVTFIQPTAGTYAGNMSGTGTMTKLGLGTLTLTGSNSYAGGTIVSLGTLQGNTSSLQGRITNNAAVIFNQTGSGTYSGDMSGAGTLTLQGGGTLTLAGTNSYTGGTTVSAGTLIGNGASLQGNILNNAAVVFDQTGSATYAGAMSGTGSMTLQGGGTLTLTGANSYTGGTTVDASTLVVNGSLAGGVTLNNGGILGGSGNIGTLVANNATIAPGNSIGTLNINGSFVQNGGTYVVEANAAGQSDRINVAGTATINGAAVQVMAATGNYATSTTYTILNATGGVSGTYTGVTSNLAFLTPSLSYDANNVFLTLALQGSAPFSGFGGNTVNQRSVGTALDQTWANATGDFATVVGALANLSTTQAGPALNAISGQPYADFGSFNAANNALFMNALGQQMALARDGARGSGQRQALAQACDVEACDAASPFSVWASALGGVGSVQGDGNASTFTYNVGGAAAGIDYRLSPGALVGIAAGYTSGTQWVDSFLGKGWSDSVSVAAYGSFTQWGAYLDVLAGYAWSNNQMQRQIFIPGLQPRTANGSTGANQFLAQAEAGYSFGIYAPAAATLTPFARFQASSINQAAFSEWGANSLSLNVAQQTTTSLRTVLGADLAAAIGPVDLGLRLGWLHEYANTARPITAAFAAAPQTSFTVYGATPQRDAAVIGFQASASVAAATQLYLRYDGEIASGADNHTLNVGLRLKW